jgi:hypothetical protein
MGAEDGEKRLVDRLREENEGGKKKNEVKKSVSQTNQLTRWN